MTEKQAQKIFEKYNPADSIVRCPNGRAPVRKLLDTYAKAAVNLYGIITKSELADIFNKQNAEQTNADEIYSLLLPLIVKSKSPWYCFYKNYIVHYWAFDDFSYADSWLRPQGDKPRFVPEKDEFLKYENQYYECKEQEKLWDKLLDFILKEWKGNYHIYPFFQQLKQGTEFNSELKEITNLLEEYNLIFRSEKQAQRFFTLLFEARNNTKLWLNKGYSPNELSKIMPREVRKEPVIHQPKKTGPNQPCPCGSGKKYKKCCSAIETGGTAKLSYDERKLFYETWYKLLDFVNRKFNVVDYKFSLKYGTHHDETLLLKIREKLWETPKLIGEYLDSANDLSDARTQLLQSWEKRHVKGEFVLLKYKPEHAVFMSMGKGKDNKLYAVKGMTTSIAEAMQRRLPVMLETVLLPFGDKIIYDSFMSSHGIEFGDGIREMFEGDYAKAKEKFGIITKL